MTNRTLKLGFVLLAAAAALACGGCAKKPPAGDSGGSGAAADYATYGQRPATTSAASSPSLSWKRSGPAMWRPAAGSFDSDALLDLVTKGIDVPADFRQGFIRGAKRSLAGDMGPLAQIVAQVKGGGHYRFLRMHDVDGKSGPCSACQPAPRA